MRPKENVALMMMMMKRRRRRRRNAYEVVVESLEEKRQLGRSGCRW
jgi:hypothetical protein